MRTQDVEYISTKDTAVIIRKELKKAFPEMRFSVRYSRYSMGSHVSVSYVDGPPTSAVEAITDQFYGTGFDGMTDSSTSHDSEYQGRPVHFGGSRPSVSRTVSNHNEVMERIETALKPYKLENPYNYNHAWQVLGSIDLRWETPERAVARFIQTDRRAI